MAKRTLSADKQRIAELEALLEKKGITPPAQLEGEYKHDDGNVYQFKKGRSGKITIGGEVREKNEVIKDADLMTQLIESGTKLIEIVGTHEGTANDAGDSEDTLA